MRLALQQAALVAGSFVYDTSPARLYPAWRHCIWPEASLPASIPRCQQQGPALPTPALLSI